jgi:hypothetical protein
LSSLWPFLHRAGAALRTSGRVMTAATSPARTLPLDAQSDVGPKGRRCL